MAGTLYLVSTPIGNLEDMTFRAIRVLKEVDLIAAEDTRESIRIINHFEIQTPMTSYHDHNKEEKGKKLVSMLMEGKNIALISDAGTPGISDPGEDLVRLCHEENITVTSCPGAVAAITGLILSGFSTGRFAFEGFLPVSKKRKKERLFQIKDETRTMVFYEAPHKILTTLKDMKETLGNRNITLARELTKKFEEIKKTTLEEAIFHYEEHTPRGEFVVIVEGIERKFLEEEEKKQWQDISIQEHLLHYENLGLNKKEAMKAVAKDRGLSKREVYQLDLELK